jgi:hypothetical protein
MTQCSIAETPTGIGPGMTCFSNTSSSNLPSAQHRRGMIQSQLSCSSTSSYGSSSELFIDPFSSSSSAFKSTDVQKGIRRYHHHRSSNYKPYGGRRRFSLNINAKDRLASFCSSGSGDSLPLRSGLSDSEASSGSGTGTPPPNYGQQQSQGIAFQHRPISLTTSGINPSYFSNIFKTNFPLVQSDLQFQETKSNPSSPVREDMTDVNTQVNQRVVQTNQTRRDIMSGLCNQMPCPLGPHVHSSHAVLTRSKSLDDLISISFISDDSSSSTDCFGTNALKGGINAPPGIMAANSSIGVAFGQHSNVGDVNAGQYSSLFSSGHNQQQLLQDPLLDTNSHLNPTLNAFSMSCVRNSQGLPLHHHSHLQLQHPSSSSPYPAASPCHQPIEGRPTTTCDTHLLENVLQGMNRLEMN